MTTINTVEVTPPTLTAYQREVLDCPARFTITEASTKSGKTFAHLWWAFEQWHRGDAPVGWEVWWVAPVYVQARIAFTRLHDNLRGASGYTFNVSGLSAINPIGRTMRFKSAEKHDNLYGENVLCFVFDEFTRARPEAFTALRSTVTFTGGKGKFIGNFIGNANWGHQLAEAHAGDPDFAYFRITAQQAVDAGIFPQDELEQARRTLHHSVFMALYMAEGSAHPLQLMRSAAINDLWTNTHVQEGQPTLICDVARFGRDSTIVGVWSGLRLLDIVEQRHGDVTETASLLGGLMQQHGVPRSRMVVDEGGVGGGVVDLLKGCIAFNGAASAVQVHGRGQNYANMRAQCYFALADAVNNGAIFVADRCSEHRDRMALELEAIRRWEDLAEGRLRINRKEEIKSMLGRSPDIADMMMMRMALELSPVNRLTATGIHNKARTLRRNALREALGQWR